jgi:hypothetical protein
VVDVAKASTTDKPHVPRLTIPSIRIEDTSSSSTGFFDTPSDASSVTPPDSGGVTEEESNGFTELSGFDDSLFSNEKLSGVGVFSPATSRASSPTLSRIRPFQSFGGELNLLPEDFGLTMRRRPKHGARTGGDNEAQS